MYDNYIPHIYRIVARTEIKVDKLNRRLDVLERLIRSVIHIVHTPGELILTILGEGTMPNVLLFKVGLPSLPELHDVVQRELTVSVNGVEQMVAVAVDQAEILDLEGPQDAQVVLSLVDVDDAGNRSEASVLEAVLVDTFAPPQPGELGITVTGERFDPE